MNKNLDKGRIWITLMMPKFSDKSLSSYKLIISKSFFKQHVCNLTILKSSPIRIVIISCWFMIGQKSKIRLNPKITTGNKHLIFANC